MMLISQHDILARTGKSPGDRQADWRQQIRQALRTPAELLDFLDLPCPPALRGARPAFPLLVPLAFARRMRRGDRGDPLLRQVLPDVDEGRLVSGFDSDPVGDLHSRRAPGVLHKYHGRLLLILTGACAVHCRYCFRQEFPYPQERASGRRWHEAVDYLHGAEDVEEIILSGGDPLMLPTAQLEDLTCKLAGFGHIKRLRLHTRMPVVLPDRVTPRLERWMQSLPWPLVVVIHANHAAEFDDEVDQALARLRASGAHVLNQAVLLAGVNDRADELVALMQRGFTAGALPYYLHQLDRVRGAQRFEVPLDRARALSDELRRRLPGYLVPKLVQEVPGMPYKTPIL